MSNLTPPIGYVEAFEDAGVTLMNLVYGNGGTPITQAAISSITLAVYECNSEHDARNAPESGTVLSGVGGSLTVASHVYDSLQTAVPWTKDTTGYNFRYNAAANCLPTGGKWYRFHFLLTPTSGAPFRIEWVVKCLSIAGT